MFNWFKTVWSERKLQLVALTGFVAAVAYGAYSYYPTSSETEEVTTAVVPADVETTQVNSVTTNNVEAGNTENQNVNNAAGADADVQ